MKIKLGTFCSGIGSPELAATTLGWKCAWASEIDPFASAVHAHHFPHTPNLGDMTKLDGGDLERADVIFAGTPCQSFSVAGLRAGMADPRGNLALVLLGLVDAARPGWLVWENVPGVLSSNGGKDFGAFLGALAELGYGFAYRVLDAQYVRTHGHERAVPQRRRRVFVVGHSDWRRAAAVLFERESMSGNHPPSREGGEGVARETANSLRSGGAGTSRVGDTRGQDNVVAVAKSLNAHGMRLDTETETETETFIAFSAKDHGADALDNVSPTIRSGGFNSSHANGGVMPAVAIPIDMRQASRGERMTNNRREGSSGGAPGTGIGEVGDPSPSLSISHTPAVAFAKNSRREVRFVGGDGSVSSAISSEPGMAQQSFLSSGYGVRRLTPLETELLQGFPPNWTNITYRGKPAADAPRYRAIGNSIAVNCSRWILERIQMVEAIKERAA